MQNKKLPHSAGMACARLVVYAVEHKASNSTNIIKTHVHLDGMSYCIHSNSIIFTEEVRSLRGQRVQQDRSFWHFSLHE